MDVYRRPYNPLYPVVCLDEASRQLIEETRVPIATKPGEPKKVDYEYRRNGVVDLFMIFEPLAGHRHVMITDSRKRIDFANCIEMIEDEFYPNCEKIVLVMDNLNTHSIVSLYTAFAHEKARQLAEKLEIHYTPKHASWLNMAEIEIGIMSRQCLSDYLANKDTVEAEVLAWCTKRNSNNSKVDWQFTTSDARIKLKRFYPVID